MQEEFSWPDKQHVILRHVKNKIGEYITPVACVDMINPKLVHVCSFNSRYCNCRNASECFCAYGVMIIYNEGD